MASSLILPDSNNEGIFSILQDFIVKLTQLAIDN